MSATAATSLKGTPASSGVAAGPVFVVKEQAPEAGVGTCDYASAVAAVADRLERMAAALPAGRDEAAAILRAQGAMARDPALATAVAGLESRGRNRVDAIRLAASAYADRLAAIDDPYLKERAADVREIGRLLVAEVRGASPSRLATLARPSIVIARELSPSDTLGAPAGMLLGIATEEGGVTSHAAIVAREMGVPAVVGAAGILAAAMAHVAAELNGDTGEVTFLDQVEVRSAAAAEVRLDVSAAPVALMANIGSLQSAQAAARRGAAGVGLFRTEFMFMSEHGPMSEDDQAAVYEAVCSTMSPHPVVIRTLDAGADKPLPYMRPTQEPNPQLGRRGIRLWLGHEELWRPQVRALIRAYGIYPSLKVMLPMVAARGEMVTARRLFATEAANMGLSVPELGMMVEVPAAAAALRTFEGVVDFVSLGTNDLTQYTVAADRGLDWEEDLGEFNPGVLRLITSAISEARGMGISAGVCGELAGHPEGAVFLVGVGVNSLSMAVDAMPTVLDAIAPLGPDRCRLAADTALVALDARSALGALRHALTKA